MKLQRLLSIILSLFSFFSIATAADVKDPLQKLVIEAESDKLHDVYQPAGTVIAVYDPYGKNLKLFHFWIGIGSPRYDWASNSDCTRPIFAWVIAKHPTWKFDPDNDPGHARMICWDDPRVKYDKRFSHIKLCRYNTDPEGQVRIAYDTRDSRLVFVNPVGGAFCRRIVDEGEIGRWGFKLNIKRGPKIKTYDGKSEMRNSYFANISYEKALDLTTFYMFIHKIPKGIFVVQTFDVYTTKSKSTFRTKITYHYVEKPLYYVIMAGVNAGQPLARGYRLLDGQGVGNNLIRKQIEIYRKSKSGWTGFGVLVFQAAFIAATWFAGGPMLVAANIPKELVAGGMALNYLAQDIKSGVFTSLWGDKPFQMDGLVRDAVAGAATAGASGAVMNDSYADDFNVQGGDGARHITQRLINGSDANTNLSGFYEAKKQVDAFDGWDKPAGTFNPNLPAELYVHDEADTNNNNNANNNNEVITLPVIGGGQ